MKFSIITNYLVTEFIYRLEGIKPKKDNCTSYKVVSYILDRKGVNMILSFVLGLMYL